MPDLPEWSIVMTIEDQENLIALGTVCRPRGCTRGRLDGDIAVYRRLCLARGTGLMCVTGGSRVLFAVGEMEAARAGFPCCWSCAAASRARAGRSGCRLRRCSRRLLSSAATGSSTGTGFKTDSFLFGLLAVGFVIYASTTTPSRKPDAEFGWRSIAWLLPWFGGMWVLSLLGDIGGGLGWLGSWPPSRASPCGA